jgi:hypothetical protein
MKKLLFLALLGTIKLSAFPIFTIVRYSWSDSSFTSYESTQWIDVKDNTTNGYSTSDSANVYLFNTATQGSGSPIYIVLTRMPYLETVHYKSTWIPGTPGHWQYTPTDSVGFQSLPLNPDSSRRIYLAMPKSFPAGEFSVNVMLWINVNGFFQSPTGINEINKSNRTIKEVFYCNELWQSVSEPKGFIIQSLIYSDGSVERRKLYIYSYR